MPGSSVRAEPRRRVSGNDLLALDGMAVLARKTGSTVHVVLAREPGVVEHARQVALRGGVEVHVDLMACSIRVRFDPRGPSEGS